MRKVRILGTGQLPVKKRYDLSLRQMGARVVQAALADANLTAPPQALYLSNMLSDELQSQKHLAALVADEAELLGIEAMQIRAATATGAAALRTGYLAIASGLVDSVVVVGVEKMSNGIATPVLAKALDAERELPDGATLLSQNALLLGRYRDRHKVPYDVFANFALNAHRNANNNPDALFYERVVTREMILASRLVSPPLRLYDCAPICDGAAAVVLGSDAIATKKSPVSIIASSGATDRFRVNDRRDPLRLYAAELSAEQAFKQSGLGRDDIDFFELHDAFSIMGALLLEAAGFAPAGEGWRLAANGDICHDGRIPIATRGGLKARGHPIGATAIYQLCEMVEQLSGTAGGNQLPSPSVGLTQSVGGAGATVFTHILSNR